MKMHTLVFAKFESKGRPKETEVIHGTVHEVMLAQAKWLMKAYMGSHIKVTLARTESELNIFTSGSKHAGATDDMIADLESVLSQEELPIGEPN